ncbi:hypothetical protein KSF78_0003721 [Schistosoma japonicum]|nr:hypothetical protein KSF78_0003721 [Schistosoma japonicum]
MTNYICESYTSKLVFCLNSKSFQQASFISCLLSSSLMHSSKIQSIMVITTSTNIILTINCNNNSNNNNNNSTISGINSFEIFFRLKCFCSTTFFLNI